MTPKRRPRGATRRRALEHVCSAILEAKARRTGERTRHVGDEDLPGAAADMTRAVSWTAIPRTSDPTSSTSPTCTPTRIWTPFFSAQRRSAAAQCGARRAVEGRQHPVPGGVRLPAAKALQLVAARLEELRQERPPARIPELRGHDRRVDEIGEQEGREHAAVNPRRESRPRLDAHPFDLHARLVPDRSHHGPEGCRTRPRPRRPLASHP